MYFYFPSYQKQHKEAPSRMGAQSSASSWGAPVLTQCKRRCPRVRVGAGGHSSRGSRQHNTQWVQIPLHFGETTEAFKNTPIKA